MPNLRKHTNNTDVAIEILKVFYVRQTDKYKLKVRWWRISRVNPPSSMQIEQRITIPRSEMHKWLSI